MSTELSDLLQSGTGFWSVGASALGPLFTFGQTTYTWRAAQALLTRAALPTNALC